MFLLFLLVSLFCLTPSKTSCSSSRVFDTVTYTCKIETTGNNYKMFAHTHARSTLVRN
nr:MAG TPA: hypothetical protein [Caudoviricetes sp.]